MFIARQPIFNKEMQVYGYELLFRSKRSSNIFDGTSDVLATATIINELFESGFESLVEDKKAFVNFDANFLNSDIIELIEPEKLIIEVLETVTVDNKLIHRLNYLSSKGYKIALDDFIEKYEDYPLSSIANIIKFDIMETPLNTIKSDIKKALKDGKVLLAEKIESDSEFQKAKDLGFHLFQGFFFSKPNIIGKNCPKTTSTKNQYMRIIKELKKPEPSYQALAEIIEKDIRLSYRLMKVISHKSGDELVYSIKRALTYMGLKDIQRWINIMMMKELNDEKPFELIKTSLIRTKFAEALAIKTNMHKLKHEASMMGLFSTIDAMLNLSIKDALTGVPVPNSVYNALVFNKGDLADIYNIIIAYEEANYEVLSKLSEKLDVSELSIYYEYTIAIKWAKETLELMESPS